MPPPAVIAAPQHQPARGILNILIADSDLAMVDFYQQQLLSLGHEVRVAQSGRQLVEEARRRHPDLVIAEIQLPGMDGVAAADELCRQRPTAVVLVSRSYEPLWVARALSNDCILACLTKLLDASALWAALAVAVRRFERMETLRAEAASARQALEDRKLIERAKGAVMHYLGVDEEEAFRRLRHLATGGNRKLCEASRAVLAAAQMFRDIEAVGGPSGNGHGTRAHGPLTHHPKAKEAIHD